MKKHKNGVFELTKYYSVCFSVKGKKKLSDCLGFLISCILNWLEKKYGKEVVEKAIPNYNDFANGCSFADKRQPSKFIVNSEKGMGKWQCKIVEFPLTAEKFVPRNWITEITYQTFQDDLSIISYSKQYEDLLDRTGQIQPQPLFSIPNLANTLLNSERWNVTLEDDNNPSRISKPEEYLPRERRWISLCKVNKPDRNQDIWMQRIADCENGTLVTPTFDESKDQIFENRRLIFWEDGPNTPDSIGYWEWTERLSESGRWKTDASYFEAAAPTEVLILENCSSIEAVVDALKTGIEFPSYLQGNMFFAFRKADSVAGVLCRWNDFAISSQENTVHSLKFDLRSLPYYEYYESDILTWKNRRFLKHVALNKSTRNMPVFALDETIKQLLLESMPWPAFKAIGISKKDWRSFRDFLTDIPRENVIEKISELYSMSIQEAQNCVDSFLKKVDNYFSVDDIDAKLFIQMIESHDGLRKKCESVAAEIWQRENAERIKSATQELSVLHEAISEQEEERNKLLSATATEQEKLNNLLAEISQKESLGNETVAAVRQKIAEAQQDMAGFIADLSVFLPNGGSISSKNQSNWFYRSGKVSTETEDDYELSDNWNNEYDAINQNLSAALHCEPELCTMLTAFLYSSNINKTPILIAGPGGVDIADIASISMYGMGAGKLFLENDCSSLFIDDIPDAVEEIIAVSNMFGRGWGDTLPQRISQSDKQVIWTHPYVEDLGIEPKGLYNYMLPVFSEVFISDWHPHKLHNLIPGKRTDNFKPYIPPKTKPIRISAIKKLGLSKLTINRLERILSDAKTLLHNSAKDTDIEVLFGLLPFSVLTGRLDILKETIENERGISNAVKAEAARYYSEE